MNTYANLWPAYVTKLARISLIVTFFGICNCKNVYE